MIICVMGSIRSGKTSYAVLQALDYINQKRNVYTNFHLKNTYRLELSDLNKYKITDGLVILDESGFYLNCNDKKAVNKNIFRFFSYCGHYDIDIIVVSQDYHRLNIAVRELLTDLVIIKKWHEFGYHKFVKAEHLKQDVYVSNSGQHGQITNDFTITHTTYHYINRAFKYFDSKSRDTLDEKIWEKWE